MSYLMLHARRRPASARAARPGARVDETTLLNLPQHDGGAHVRALVENTTAHRGRRRRLPSPRLKLRITDCTNQIHLEFSVDTPDLRENSRHKIETLIAALERFRNGLAAESELRAERERRSRPRKETRCRT
jgi:hypothetical protein